MKKSLNALVAALGASLLVIACGGGGGGGDAVGGGGNGGGGGGGGGGNGNATSWQIAQLLETSNTQAGEADVSIDADGGGYAVWQQPAGGASNVFASRYRDGVWEPALPVTAGNVDTLEPQVAVLPNGEALAIWRQALPTPGEVGVFHSLTKGGVWQAAELVQGQAGDVANLELVADAQGNAMAVWSRKATPAISRIYASAFRSSKFEQVAQQISEGSTNAVNPDIAMDTAGNVLAAWSQVDAVSGFSSIVTRPYVVDAWREFAIVSGANVDVNASSPDVAVGPDGGASVVWQDTDQFIRMSSSLSFVDSVWNEVQNVAATATGRHFGQQVTVDGLGHTTVVFLNTEAGRTSVKSYRRLASGVVSQPLVPEGGEAIGVRIGSDAQGGVVALWGGTAAGARANMVSSRLNPETGVWGAIELVETEDGGNAGFASLAVNAAGRALAAWMQQNGTTDPATGLPLNSAMGNVLK